MDIFDEPYYRINKRILCIIGQWPYQSVLERSVKTVFILIVIASLVTPQIMKVPQVWGEIDIVIECISPLITNSASVTKLLNCIVNTRKIKNLLDETREDWENMRYLPEIRVLREYGEKGRRLTIMYSTYLYVVVATWISVPLMPMFMDLVSPLNASRSHIVLFQTDYKIDPDKYFYLIYVHGCMSTWIIVLIIVAVDSLYMTTAQHACATLEILRNDLVTEELKSYACRYRLENIISQEDEKLSIEFNPNRHEDVHFQQIVICIKKHKRAIGYVRTMESSCEWSLFLIIGLNMLVMSFTGARTVAKTTRTIDVLRFAVFTVAQMIHLYCNSLPGQWIIDSSSCIRDSAYNCKWYLMSLRSRKLLVLLLRQSIEPCTITAGKLYVMSKENFCGVLQTSMSYFTLLTSLQ